MGTKYSNTILMGCNTDANVRGWVGFIVDSLVEAGWTRTTDTGQTEVSELIAATAASTVLGYQIYKKSFGGTDVYVKFEFGSGVSISNTSIWYTIGTGSDGAGNITGILLARTRVYQTSSNATATTTRYSFATWGTNYFGFSMWSIGTNANTIGRQQFSIEAICGEDGIATGDGVCVILEACGGTSGALTPVYFYNGVILFSGTSPASSSVLGSLVPSGTTMAKDGGVVGVSPVFFYWGGLLPPSKVWMVYMSADLSVRASVNADLYGNETWMPLGVDMMPTAVSGNSASCLMLRWSE